MYERLFICLAVLILTLFPLSAFAGNIDPYNDGSQYAWGENVGWISFAPTGGGVCIDSSGKFIGKAWGENIGWISFNSTGPVTFGVTTSWQAYQPPTIGYSPTSFSFSATKGGANPPSQTLDIGRPGGGSGKLSWRVSSNAQWLR